MAALALGGWKGPAGRAIQGPEMSPDAVLDAHVAGDEHLIGLGQIGQLREPAALAETRSLALVSTTWEVSRRPLVPTTATVQLDVWASKPIYLSMGVLLSGAGV
jgi:hypothetical protein